MSSIQQFLVIGGLFLLGILILNTNKANSISSDQIYNNEAVIAGTGAGQTLINQILSKAFDEKTVTSAVTKISDLTPAAKLGKDTGENSITEFNDVDDYDSYSDTETIGRLGDFDIKISVYYVTYNSPDVKSSTATFLKRIDVAVTNSLLKDKLKFSQLVSY